MTCRRAVAVLLTAFALLLAACGPSAAPGLGSFPETLEPELQWLLERSNEARAAGAVCGSDAMAPAPPLGYDARLGRAAQKHSEDMAAAGVIGHTTPPGAVHYPPGTAFYERVEAEGYVYRSTGENVAWNYPDPDAAVAAWLASPGHCRNLMNPAFREIGLGQERLYWTQVFGTPR